MLEVPEEEFGRLESRYMLFGVGLVLFKVDKSLPDWDIRVRAQRFTPDMFYLNQFAYRLRDHNSQMFERLFK